MQYPVFPELPPTRGVAESMIRDLAWQERESVARSGQSIPVYAARLGSLCMVYDDERQNDTRTIGAIPPERAVFQALHAIVLSNSPEQQHRRQQDLHESVIEGVERLLGRKDEASVGKMAEFVTLALHTRYAHPGIQAYFALPQYERSADKAGHFDVGVVYDMPGTKETESHYFQVKNSCLGRCGREIPEHSDYALRSYRDFIQLVSACCDLRLKNNRNGNLQVPRLLIAEAHDEIQQNGIEMLDNLTDSLIFSASAGLLLKGKHGASGSNASDQISKLQQRFNRR